MKTIINNNNLETLIIGASIFTTGGGITVPDQLKALSDININVEINSLDELDKEGFICTVGEIGPTDVPPLRKDKIIRKMAKLLQANLGKNIVGIFPPEIGQESVVIECAQLLNLPIVDFDPVGFRAVPYFDISIFNIKKIDFKLTPIVVCNDKLELFLIKNTSNFLELEKKLRDMTRLSNSGLIFVMGIAVSVKELINSNIKTNSYAKALKFGSLKTRGKLLKLLKPKRIINAKVVGKMKIKKQGFLAEKVIIKDEKWNLYTLIMQNEAIFLLNSEKDILESVPDRILLLDPKENKGLSGSFLEPGIGVTIVVIDPTKEWKSKSALKIFGKERFEELLK